MPDIYGCSLECMHYGELVASPWLSSSSHLQVLLHPHVLLYLELRYSQMPSKGKKRVWLRIQKLNNFSVPIGFGPS